MLQNYNIAKNLTYSKKFLHRRTIIIALTNSGKHIKKFRGKQRFTT
jgi:hypothetical protein